MSEKSFLIKNAYSDCFKLLGAYTKENHKCFATEFMPGDRVVTTCFGPSRGGSMGSANRYACRYLEIDLDSARRIARDKCLADTVKHLLGKELSEFNGMFAD